MRCDIIWNRVDSCEILRGTILTIAVTYIHTYVLLDSWSAPLEPYCVLRYTTQAGDLRVIVKLQPDREMKWSFDYNQQRHHLNIARFQNCR